MITARFYLILIFFVGMIQYAALSSGESLQAVQVESGKITQKRRLIKILSIDGGGIRGIIPAAVLAEIEKRLQGGNLVDYFDVMAGTSAGGIIVLLLNKPGIERKPQYNANDVLSLYKSFGSKAFHRSPLHFFLSLGGLLDERYPAAGLEKLLDSYFSSSTLRDSLTNVIIPAYDISLDEMIFFKSSLSKERSENNFYFKDVARATSAAPTYFSPARIKDLNGSQEYAFVDGGIALNNPTLTAILYALSLFGKGNEFLIVSLGTGTNYSVDPGRLSYNASDIKGGGVFRWGPTLIPVMMYAVNDVVNDQVSEVLSYTQREQIYIRLQPTLKTEDTSMDNASPHNIQRLERYAQDLIQEHSNQIDMIVSLLKNKS